MPEAPSRAEVELLRWMAGKIVMTSPWWFEPRGLDVGRGFQDVPQDCIGYVTGNRRAALGGIEEVCRPSVRAFWKPAGVGHVDVLHEQGELLRVLRVVIE